MTLFEIELHRSLSSMYVLQAVAAFIILMEPQEFLLNPDNHQSEIDRLGSSLVQLYHVT